MRVVITGRIYDDVTAKSIEVETEYDNYGASINASHVEKTIESLAETVARKLIAARIA